MPVTVIFQVICLTWLTLADRGCVYSQQPADRCYLQYSPTLVVQWVCTPGPALPLPTTYLEQV